MSDIDLADIIAEGYNLFDILDENEELITTNECIHKFVAGESKIFLFEVVDSGAYNTQLWRFSSQMVM